MRKGLPVALACLLLVGVAQAAKPAKGKSYAGTLAAPRNSITVNFAVTKNGKKVKSLVVGSVPLYCQGGGPSPQVHFANAAITKKGTFKSKAMVLITVGPMTGQVGEKFKITGKFGAGGTESGTLKTTYVNSPECGGSSGYTTTAG